MKVLIKDKTKDFKIQIEDWSEDYSFKKYGSTVAVYQLAKEDVGYFKRNTMCRFEFDFKDHDETLKAYNDLLSGNKTPKDFVEFLSDSRYAIAL